MADKLVDPLVSFSVKMLLNLLVQEARFLGSVRGEVDDMKRELTRIQCFLIDADKRRGGQGREDAVVSNLVVEIQELAYDAEEVITTFIVKVAGEAEASSAIERPPPVCFGFKAFFCFFKTSPRRHEVGNQIQEINRKIGGLTRSLQTYGVQSRSVPTKPRITYSPVVEENVVGLQDYVTTVVGHLKDRTHARAISIWGMGGLGKTTFSKEILRHREIKHYFDHVAWVCVSEQCNEHQVWRDILLGFAHQSEDEKKVIRKLTPNELVDRLDSLQKEKKCLVILDDIWKQDDWNSLCHAFPTATNTGSKIVLTTRNKELLALSSFRSFSYQMPSLKEDECVQLLKNKALSQEHELISTEMNSTLKKIVEGCEGLPLAIVVIGGLLANDKTLDGWEKVRLDLHNCLNRGNDRNKGVREVLGLSYQDLPYHLKACFLYLSLFPEDHDIHAESLVQMWIAEGFVSAARRGEGTKTTLDVGLSYLDELVNRCMVQANISKFSRRVKTIRLHDLMRDFCLSKALEENFYDDLGLQHSPPSTSSPNTIRRLAVYLRDGQQQVITVPHGQQYQHVRSCLVNIADGEKVTESWGKVNSLLKGFKFLKVLNPVGIFHDSNDGLELSQVIGKLVHLRYLRLPDLLLLPNSLGNLILLQTLDLRMFLGVWSHRIPNVLWKLKELRHLYLPVYSQNSKYRLDGLSNLETLVNFNTSRSDIGDLATMPNLRKVHIECQVKELGKILEYPAFSNSNSLLRRSTFKIEGNAETQEEHKLLYQVLARQNVVKFSLYAPVQEDYFLPKLNMKITSIDLCLCGLKEDPMPSLGMMPYLRKLVLRTGSYIGKKMECCAPKKMTGGETSSSSRTSTGGFPQLTFLWLFAINISEWKVAEGAMTCLSKLFLLNCTELKKIPNGLRFISTLEEVLIMGANESLNQRLQQGGEDFHKIQHAPFITIQ